MGFYAFILIIIMGIIGMYISLFFGFGGDLGVIFAIAVMGTFILSAIEKTQKK